jgi:general secretion pathway protein J
MPLPRSAPPAATRPRARASASGFTLVEVLVALFIMAILAGMAWQGIDALVRTRDGALRATDQALQVSTVIAQWEQDLSQLQQGPGVQPVRYDGVALRLSRRTPDGLQWVVWTLQGQTLYRWASPPVTRLQEFEQWVQRGQQWAALRETALPMLTDVSQWQVYYFRPGDNTWSNAQSSGATGSVVIPTAPPKAPPPTSKPPKTSEGSGTVDSADDTTPPPDAPSASADLAPSGVRLVLSLPAGTLTRDLMLPGSQ